MLHTRKLKVKFLPCLSCIYIGELSEKMPATATCDSNHYASLGHLGWRDINRNICVTLPKGAKASILTLQSHVAVANSFTNKCRQCK
jgi:hypothetical protein